MALGPRSPGMVDIDHLDMHRIMDRMGCARIPTAGDRSTEEEGGAGSQ